MTDLSFAVSSKTREPITFTLDGNDHVYTFTPGKQASVFMPILKGDDTDEEVYGLSVSRATFSWLDEGMTPEDVAHLEARLRDPKDDLDFTDLGPVVKGLMEASAARPTT